MGDRVKFFPNSLALSAIKALNPAMSRCIIAASIVKKIPHKTQVDEDINTMESLKLDFSAKTPTIRGDTAEPMFSNVLRADVALLLSSGLGHISYGC